MTKVRITDDRSGPHELAINRDRLPGDRAMRSRLDGHIQSVNDEVKRGWVSWWLGVLVVALYFIIRFSLRAAGYDDMPSNIIGFSAAMLIMFAARALHRRGTPPLANAAYTQALLHEAICPTCGYDLFGAEPEADGCTVCPECGAAWRASRIRRVTPLAAMPAGESIVPEALRPARLLAPWSPDKPSMRPRIRDDRGVCARLLVPRTRSILRTSDEALAARMMEARSVARQDGRAIRVLLAAVLFAIALFSIMILGTMFEAAGRTAGWILLAAFSVNTVLYFVLGLNVLRSRIGIRRHRACRALLRQRLCPACCADLASTPPDPASSLTSCPTCTAAWRLPEQQSPTP